MILDILSTTSGEKHPKAKHSDIKFHSNDRDGTKFINQVGLFGDLVAVQLSSTYGALFVSSIRVYNWKTSEEVSVLPSLLLQGKRLLTHACLLVATGSFLTLLP